MPYQSSFVNEPHPTPAIRISRASVNSANTQNNSTPELVNVPDNSLVYSRGQTPQFEPQQFANQVIVQFPDTFFLPPNIRSTPTGSWNMINNRNGHDEGTHSNESHEDTLQIRPNTPI